jgi:carbamoyl-phosphate synthase large subunit
MLKDKKIFISGGNGVIGNELIKKLFQMGAILYVGDLKPRPRDWPAEILYRQGDLNYITETELTFFEPEYFFHLAATFERSTETYEFWQENYHHNMRLSHHLMDCFKNIRTLKKVIFASSYLIYNPELYSFQIPMRKAINLKETDPVYPRNLCGGAKLLHELELRFISEFNLNVDTVSARIFRSYGKNSRDVISRWIRALLNNESLTVFRKEGLFDYIYAGDVAEGLIKLAVSPAKGIVNLGTGNARRINDVLDVLKIYFPEMKYQEVHADIPYEASQADMEYFEKITGWRPVKRLEDTIPELIWYEKNNRYLIEAVQSKKNILVTSISKKVPLLKSIRRASLKLGNQDVIFGADLDKECIGKYFVDVFWEMPKLSDLKINQLIEYCKNNCINRIVPTRDGELMFFAKHKEMLKQNGIFVMVSNEEATNICLDKLLFYEKLAENGFPAIFTVKDINLLNTDLFVVKERYGAGAQKIGLKLSKKEALQHQQKLDEPIYQPFVYGNEVSVDIYIDLNGNVKGAIARSRDKIVNGESQITKTFRNERLEKLCTNIAQKFNLYGHVIFQVLIDNEDNFHIIECNCRFGGASTLSVLTGLDSFYWFFLETLGENLDNYPFVRSVTEKQQVRYPEDLTF